MPLSEKELRSEIAQVLEDVRGCAVAHKTDHTENHIIRLLSLILTDRREVIEEIKRVVLDRFFTESGYLREDTHDLVVDVETSILSIKAKYTPVQEEKE